MTTDDDNIINARLLSRLTTIFLSNYQLTVNPFAHPRGQVNSIISIITDNKNNNNNNSNNNNNNK